MAYRILEDHSTWLGLTGQLTAGETPWASWAVPSGGSGSIALKNETAYLATLEGDRKGFLRDLLFLAVSPDLPEPPRQRRWGEPFEASLTAKLQEVAPGIEMMRVGAGVSWRRWNPDKRRWGNECGTPLDRNWREFYPGYRVRQKTGAVVEISIEE